MTNLLCNKLFVLAPYYLKLTSGNSAFIAILLFYVVAFVLFRLCINLYPQKKDLLDVTQYKSQRLIIGVIVSLAFCIVTTLTLRQFSEGIKVMTMRKSPVSFIGGIFGFAMIFGATCGIKSIAKTNNFFVPFIYAAAILLTLATINKNDLLGIFPIFGYGLNVIIPKGFIILSMLFETIVFFILPPNLYEPNDIKKIGNYSFLFSLVIFITIGGIYCIITPPSSNFESYEPFFRLIKQIELGNFLQRFDSLFLILYCLSAFLYLSTSLYFSTYIFTKTFKLSETKFLVAPIGTLIICCSFINYLQEYMFNVIEKIYYILWIIAFIIPYIALIKFRRIK